ncbi:MAG: hypothetical protein WCP11_00240 [Candidatus Saccharibacteria bacterium]
MNKKTAKKSTHIEEKVMSQIGGGKVHMQSRSYYIVMSIVGIAAIIGAVMSAAYFISVASLFIRLQIAQGPAYGVQRTLDSLLSDFPWLAVLLGVSSIVAVILMITKSGKMYKIRLAYLVPIVIAVILTLGFAFSYSSLPNFGNRGQNSEIQPARGYQHNR